MAPTTDTDNLVLLLSTMKSIQMGKPNWQAVAEDMKLPTAGAAAKRFSRLLQSNNMLSPFASAASTPNSKRKATPTKTEEGEAGGGDVSPSPAPKKARQGVKKEKIKIEEEVVKKEKIKIEGEDGDGE